MSAKRGRYGPLCPLSPVPGPEAQARIEAAMEQGLQHPRLKRMISFAVLKAGAEARMKQVDGMSAEQRHVVYAVGLTVAKLADGKTNGAKRVREILAKRVRGPGDLGV